MGSAKRAPARLRRKQSLSRRRPASPITLRAGFHPVTDEIPSFLRAETEAEPDKEPAAPPPTVPETVPQPAL